MRVPLLIACGLVALVLSPPAVAACEGNTTTISVVCSASACVKFYLVAGGPNLALYQENNGVANLQRGISALLQGGNDNCFTVTNPDFRLI